MVKIYWYKKLDGTIFEESEDAAWRVHRRFLSPAHRYEFLGWSDGRFVKAVKASATKDVRGILTNESVSEEDRSALLEARDKEIEFAIANEDRAPPVDRSRKEIVGGGHAGQIVAPQTPGLKQRLGG